jgi:hypothetical protein
LSMCLSRIGTLKVLYRKSKLMIMRDLNLRFRSVMESPLLALMIMSLRKV